MSRTRGGAWQASGTAGVDRSACSPTGAALRRSSSLSSCRCCCRMYFVTMEVSQGIETNKKVSRVGSMVADLVTQQQMTTKAELDAIMAIGESLLAALQPLAAQNHHHRDRDHRRADPKVKVFWSRKLVNGVASQDRGKGHHHYGAGGTQHARARSWSASRAFSNTSRSSPGRPPTSRRSGLPRPSTTSP